MLILKKQKKMSEIEKLKQIFMKNLKFRIYIDNKINKLII